MASSYCAMASILILSLTLNTSANTDNVKLIRGVELKLQSFYSSNKDFTCLDGSNTIPFSSVNDDYCDCRDGTDEPGTSACPEGKYYCYNIGYKSKYVQSSRVNDGICDCCDGSDEYDSSVVCFNECEKFGLAEQEMKKEEMAETIEGSKVKSEYIQSGKEKKELKKARIDTINGIMEQRVKELEDAKVTKEAAEAPETEAKDKHAKEWDELQTKLKSEEDTIDRNAAFDVLDSDKDGWITMAELLSNNYLESDMSESEAKEMLSGETMVDREGIVNVWKSIKPKFMKDGRPDPSQFDESDRDDKPPETAEEDKKEDGEKVGELNDENALKSDSSNILSNRINDAKEELKKMYDDKEDDDEDRDGYKSAESYLPEGGDDGDDEDDEEDKEDKDDHGEDNYQDTKSEDERPGYNEATKQLIEIADKARSHFETVDKIVKELENEKKDLEDYLSIDFGTHEEFSSLRGECYEYMDREYVYKLCPFEKVTQKNKDGGGSETDLGNKMVWVGKDAFTTMKYEGGQTCWNGPARSTLVHLSCGKENLITAVGEPNRCEYEMNFKTPAMCDHVTEHDEL